MALNGYSEKEPFEGDGAGVPTSTGVVVNSPREQKLQRVSGCCFCTPILG